MYGFQLNTFGRHYYPNVGQRFPALAVVEHLQPVRALLISSMICTIFSVDLISVTDAMFRRYLAASVLEVCHGQPPGKNRVWGTDYIVLVPAE